MLSLSIDTDWAPTPVIRDTLDLFDDYDLTTTVFSTHDDGLELDGHERALHPNFLDEEDDRDDEAVLAELVETFPDAVGTRSHSLYTHGQLHTLYPKYDLTYESNYMAYREPNLRPYWMGRRFIQLPIYFMDDVWMNRERTLPDIEALLNEPGFKMFTFHPIHIYLNTPTLAYYDDHRDDYQNPDAILEARYEGEGVRTLLKRLLDEVERRDEAVRAAASIAADAAEHVPFRDES